MTNAIGARFLRTQNFIGGQWLPARDGATFPVTNPATGAVITTVPRGGAPDAVAAVAAASAAFPAWRALPAGKRASLLSALAAGIRAHHEVLAQLLTAEQGKSIVEARAEIESSAAYIQWFAEEARRIYGELVPSPWADRKIMVMREPVGVVAAITPWNFPALMLARKLGAALAAGCTVVLKPASQTPLSALAWGVLCEEVGIPAGVVNVVTGSAGAIGKVLTSAKAVRKITFTGSTEVGKILAQQAGAHMKRVSMELGGNAPFIVFDDADLDAAVQGAMVAKYRNAGQTCVCVNRFYVQDGIYDRFAAALAEKVAMLTVGNGADETAQLGPLIDDAAVGKIEEHIADALARGGALLTGGHRHPLGGTFFEPTVIGMATAAMLVAREETFAPLAALFRFRDEDEALAMANDSEYGLAGYFYTTNLARAFRVADALECGMIGLNTGFITTEVAPFGGIKQSGMGREGSQHGLADYLQYKYLSLAGLDH